MKIGDIVYLYLGLDASKIAMSVVAVSQSNKSVKCQWFSTGWVYQESWFNITQLRYYSSEL